MRARWLLLLVAACSDDKPNKAKPLADRSVASDARPSAAVAAKPPAPVTPPDARAHAAATRHHVDGPVGALAVNPEDGWVAIAVGATIIKWNPANDAAAPLVTEPAAVTALAFSHDGELLACGGADGVVRVIDVWTKATKELHGPASQVRSVRFSDDDAGLRSIADNGEIRDWDLKSGGSVTTRGVLTKRNPPTAEGLVGGRPVIVRVEGEDVVLSAANRR